MSKEKKKDAEKTKKLVTSIVLWSLGGIALLIILLWDYIFKGKPIYAGGNGFAAIGEWFKNNIDKLVYTIVIIGVIALVIALFGLVMNFIKIKNRKISTVISLIRSLVKWALILIAAFFILQKWGAKPEQILASIGILALIIGLGCQTLISDIISGIFLVADDAFQVGDIVVVDDFRGTVTEIGLKNTKLEDAGGNVKIISNSSINTMVNLTNALSLAVVELSIPYEENLSRTETLLVDRLKDMKERIPAIVDGPYYKGIEDMGDSAVILKVIATVKEEDRFQTTRDIKRDLYIFLNENKITVPYPQLTITQGPNPADHPEWKDKEKEEKKAQEKIAESQEESAGMDQINDLD